MKQMIYGDDYDLIVLQFNIFHNPMTGIDILSYFVLVELVWLPVLENKLIFLICNRSTKTANLVRLLWP